MGNQWGGHLPLRPPNQDVGGDVSPRPPIIAAPGLTTLIIHHPLTHSFQA